MSELKKYVEKLNVLIKRYKAELSGAARDDKTAHLEAILIRLENDMENADQYEKESVFRAAVVQSLEERYKHETENAESYINHVLNPSNDIDTLLSETALVDVKPAVSSSGPSTATAVYYSNANVVSYTPDPAQASRIEEGIVGILLDAKSPNGISNPAVMQAIIAAFADGDTQAGAPGVGHDKITRAFYDRMLGGVPAANYVEFIKALDNGPMYNMVNFIDYTTAAAVPNTQADITEFLALCICDANCAPHMSNIVDVLIKNTPAFTAVANAINTSTYGTPGALIARIADQSVQKFIAHSLCLAAGGWPNIAAALVAGNIDTTAQDPGFKRIIRYINDNAVYTTEFVTRARANVASYPRAVAIALCTEVVYENIAQEIIHDPDSITTIAASGQFVNIMNIIDSSLAAAQQFAHIDCLTNEKYQSIFAAALCAGGADKPNIVTGILETGAVANPNSIAVAAANEHLGKIADLIETNGTGGDATAMVGLMAHVGNDWYRTFMATLLCMRKPYTNISTAVAGIGGTVDTRATDADFMAVMQRLNRGLFPTAALLAPDVSAAANKFIAEHKTHGTYQQIIASALCVISPVMPIQPLLHIALAVNNFAAKISNLAGVDEFKTIIGHIEANTTFVGGAAAGANAAALFIARRIGAAHKKTIATALCLAAASPNIAASINAIGTGVVAVVAADPNVATIMGHINNNIVGNVDDLAAEAFASHSGDANYQQTIAVALCVNANLANITAKVNAMGGGGLINAAGTGLAESVNFRAVMVHINNNTGAADEKAAVMFVARRGVAEYQIAIATALCIPGAASANIARAINTIVVGGNRSVALAAADVHIGTIMNHINDNKGCLVGEEKRAALAFVTSDITNLDYRRTMAVALCVGADLTHIVEYINAIDGAAGLVDAAGGGLAEKAAFRDIMIHINDNTGAADEKAAVMFVARRGVVEYQIAIAAALCTAAANSEHIALAINAIVNGAGANSVAIVAGVDEVEDIMGHINANAGIGGGNAAVAFVGNHANANYQRTIAVSLCVAADLPRIATAVNGIGAHARIADLAGEAKFTAITTIINDNKSVGGGGGGGEAAVMFVARRTVAEYQTTVASALCAAGAISANIATAINAIVVGGHNTIASVAGDASVMAIMDHINVNTGGGANRVAAAAFAANFTNAAYQRTIAITLCVAADLSSIVAELITGIGVISAIAARAEFKTIMGHIEVNTGAAPANAAAAAAFVARNTVSPEYKYVMAAALCVAGTPVPGNPDRATLPVIVKAINSIAGDIAAVAGNASFIYMAQRINDNKDVAAGGGDNAAATLFVANKDFADHKITIAAALCVDADLDNIIIQIDTIGVSMAGRAGDGAFGDIVTHINNNTATNGAVTPGGAGTHAFVELHRGIAGYYPAIASALCVATELTNIAAAVNKIDAAASIAGAAGLAGKGEFGSIMLHINDNTGGVANDAAATLFLAHKSHDEYKKTIAAALCVAIAVDLDRIAGQVNRIGTDVGNRALDGDFVAIMNHIDQNTAWVPAAVSADAANAFMLHFDNAVYQLIIAAALCINADLARIVTATNVMGGATSIATLAVVGEFRPIMDHINVNTPMVAGPPHPPLGPGLKAAANAFIGLHTTHDDGYKKIIAAALCIDADLINICTAVSVIGGAVNVEDLATKDYFKAIMKHIDDNTPVTDGAAVALLQANVIDARRKYNEVVSAAMLVTNGVGHPGTIIQCPRIWHMIANSAGRTDRILPILETAAVVGGSTVPATLRDIITSGSVAPLTQADKNAFRARADAGGHATLAPAIGALNVAVVSAVGGSPSIFGGGYSSLVDYSGKIGGALVMGGCMLGAKSIILVIVVLLTIILLVVMNDNPEQNEAPVRPYVVQNRTY